MINDLPYDITHLTIGIQKVAELINKCLVLATPSYLPAAASSPAEATSSDPLMFPANRGRGCKYSHTRNSPALQKLRLQENGCEFLNFFFYFF